MKLGQEQFEREGNYTNRAEHYEDVAEKRAC